MLANTINNAANELAANTENTEMGVLPCPHFEGVENRIEIDFHAGGLQRGACPTLSFFQSAARFTTWNKP